MIELTEPTGLRGRARRWWCRRRGHHPVPFTASGTWTVDARVRPQPVVAAGVACGRCRSVLAEPDWPPGCIPQYLDDLEVTVGETPVAARQEVGLDTRR